VREEDLQSLGIHRIPVPVPFPQAGGPVNVYAIEEEDGGLALFDTGLGSDEARAALDEGFRRMGRRIEEVRRVVVSHGHVDHFGNAQAIAERSGAPVLAHAGDIGKIAASGPRWKEKLPHYGAFLSRMGVPTEVLAALAAELGGGFSLARRVDAVHAIGEGERLRFRRFEAEVRHLPGHTPGLVCLHAAAEGLLFAADHLLERVSPNPLIELGPEGEEGFFFPLVAYLGSIARTRELELRLVLPGHGPPFEGHRQVIDDLLRFYRRRQDRICEELAAGPRTAYEVSVALFPRARAGDAFLILSETVANLEVLEASARVARDEATDGWRFRIA